MKNILSLCFFSLLSLSVWAKKVDVTISGMSCGMCEGKITESLKKTGKCKDVSVSAKGGKASFDAQDDLTDAEIKKAIEEAGYKATKITRS
jgi:copper chaperone